MQNHVTEYEKMKKKVIRQVQANQADAETLVLAPKVCGGGG